MPAYDSGLANYVNIPYVNITNGVHSVEVDWGNDGHLTFWIDGVQKGSLTGVNNSISAWIGSAWVLRSCPSVPAVVASMLIALKQDDLPISDHKPDHNKLSHSR